MYILFVEKKKRKSSWKKGEMKLSEKADSIHVDMVPIFCINSDNKPIFFQILLFFQSKKGLLTDRIHHIFLHPTTIPICKCVYVHVHRIPVLGRLN